MGKGFRVDGPCALEQTGKAGGDGPRSAFGDPLDNSMAEGILAASRSAMAEQRRWTSCLLLNLPHWDQTVYITMAERLRRKGVNKRQEDEASRVYRILRPVDDL